MQSEDFEKENEENKSIHNIFITSNLLELKKTYYHQINSSNRLDLWRILLSDYPIDKAKYDEKI